MAPDELLRALEGAGLHLTAQDGALTVHPKSALTEESRELIRAHKTALIELLSHQTAPPEDLSPQCRKAQAMLDAYPALDRAIATDTTTMPDTVILAVAVRGVGVGEIWISQDSYDGMAVLLMLERVSAGVTTH